ncbi:MAG: hypothetical protein GX222_04840 [Ruminococcaceae bacterium]|nr:hypothetical protein [Oscillospiraceae bacterium]
MSKSIYSLTLYDEIISVVDKNAERCGLNRSSYLNAVLAEYFGLDTPRFKAGEMAEAFVDEAKSRGLSANRNTDCSAVLMTKFSYLYNPTLRYRFEANERGDYCAKIRVSVRSSNPALQKHLDDFYHIWLSLESNRSDYDEERHEISNGVYTRFMKYPDEVEKKDAGRHAAQYLSLFDSCIKTFFKNLDDNCEAKVSSTYFDSILKLKLR